MKLVANCVMKTSMWSPFLLLSNTVREIREKLFPRLKSQIQIRDFFPAKPEKFKICEIKLPWKISRHTINCERFCFSCNLSTLVSRFQQSRVWELRKFFGQESHRPSKFESARMPMTVPWCVKHVFIIKGRHPWPTFNSIDRWPTSYSESLFPFNECNTGKIQFEVRKYWTSG